MAALDRQERFSRSLKPGMAYLVNIPPRAERDFASLYQEINVEESDAALE